MLCDIHSLIYLWSPIEFAHLREVIFHLKVNSIDALSQVGQGFLSSLGIITFNFPLHFFHRSETKSHNTYVCQNTCSVHMHK